MMMSGCASGVTSTTPEFCAVYRPVPTLYCGSETQQLTVDQNNAVYLEMCVND